jgi:hypothetical protein
MGDIIVSKKSKKKFLKLVLKRRNSKDTVPVTIVGKKLFFGRIVKPKAEKS